MSLDIVYRCPVTGRELPPHGSFVRDGARLCDCHNQQVAVTVESVGEPSAARLAGALAEAGESDEGRAAA